MNRIRSLYSICWMLAVVTLLGTITCFRSPGGFLGTWSRNRWNVELLKIAALSTSTTDTIDRYISQRIEQRIGGMQAYTARNHFHLGRVYEILGDHEAAISSYEGALVSSGVTDLEPSLHSMLLYRLGRLLFTQQFYAKAIPVLQAGVDLAKTGDHEYAAQMYWWLAESVYAYQGDKVTYEQYMLAALDRKPTDVGLNQALVEHYLSWNDLDKALALSERWSIALPTSSRPVFYTGQVHQKAGDCLAAQVFYRKAISMEPQDFLSHFWLAFCDDQMGNLEPAILEFQCAISLAPSEWWIYRHLGNTLIKNGQFAEAEDILIKGLSLNPQDGWTQQLLKEARTRK